MPRKTSRLLMSLGGLLAINTSYVPLALFLFERYTHHQTVLMSCNVVCGAAIVMLWLAVWGPQVRWSGWLVGLSVLSVPAAALVPAAMLSGWSWLAGGWDREMSPLFAGVLWQGWWILLISWLWRSSRLQDVRQAAAEKQLDVPCPGCGYDLTGLQHAECPECGTSFTLEQLIAGVLHHESPSRR